MCHLVPCHGVPERMNTCLQMLSDAFTAQTAELKATVKSLEDMVRRMELGRSAADKQDAVTLSELRQEFRSFSATLTE